VSIGAIGGKVQTRLILALGQFENAATLSCRGKYFTQTQRYKNLRDVCGFLFRLYGPDLFSLRLRFESLETRVSQAYELQ